MAKRSEQTLQRKGTWGVHYPDGRRHRVEWEIHYDSSTNTTFVRVNGRTHIHIGKPGENVKATFRTVPKD